MNEISLWSFWINSRLPLKEKEFSDYDILVEEVIRVFNLKSKSRKVELKDIYHFFLEWWWKNKNSMKVYVNKNIIAKQLGVQHANIIHYVGSFGQPGIRKKTLNFTENTKIINSYIYKKII